VTLAPKGLLIEEQRVNLLTYSSDYSNAAWGAKTGISLSAGATAPDGGTSTLVENTFAGTRFIGQEVTVVAVTTYTATVYMKKGTTNFGALTIVESPTQGFWTFNLDTGAVGNNITSTKTSTASIQDAGNGWYRCSVTAASVGTSITVRVVPVTSVDVATGTIGDNINVWGAQVELGAFQTSYIPSVASQVTRAADNASMIGNNFARWYNVNEGSIYVEALTVASTSTAGQIGTFVSINDTTISNRIRMTTGSINGGIFSGAVGNVTQFGLGTAPTLNTFNKFAGAYKINDFALSQNGGTVATTVSGLIPVVSQLQIGNFLTTRELNGTIKRFAYFNRRLADSELQGISS
jgi:hypothetical protein